MDIYFMEQKISKVAETDSKVAETDTGKKANRVAETDTAKKGNHAKSVSEDKEPGEMDVKVVNRQGDSYTSGKDSAATGIYSVEKTAAGGIKIKYDNPKREKLIVERDKLKMQIRQEGDGFRAENLKKKLEQIERKLKKASK